MLAALAALAGGQYGVVHLAQLLELGFSRFAVGRMVEAGRLHRLYRGVYAVGHEAIQPRGKLLAAVYACGPNAVASHQQAAWVHDLRRGWGRWIHVTTSDRGRRAPAGIKLHRVRCLHPEDVRVVERIPVTSVARALLDCADTLPKPQYERVFEEAERRGLLDARAVERVCARARGRKAVTACRAALAEAHPHQPMTRSDLEREFLAFCREIDVPPPSMNVWILGQRPRAQRGADRGGDKGDPGHAETARARARDAPRPPALTARC